MLVRSLGWEDPLEKGMATRSSILTWRNPWTEDQGTQGCKESNATEATQHAHTYSAFPVWNKRKHFEDCVLSSDDLVSSELPFLR